jgi:phosphoribosylformylglycinamidine synthase subunit PurL
VLKGLWGLPPALDMEKEKRMQEALREIVRAGLAESAHDLADGGLAVALAESCFGPAEVGARIDLDSPLRPELLLFHEGPSRALISTAQPEKVAEIAARHGVEAPVLGVTMKGELEINRGGTRLAAWKVDTLRSTWEGSLEHYVR